jgi:hypothetical protein
LFTAARSAARNIARALRGESPQHLVDKRECLDTDD